MAGVPSRQDIIRCLEEAREGPLRPRDLGRKLGVGQEDYRAFRRVLSQMEGDGQVYRQRKGRYGIPRRFELVTGTLDLTRAGDGFVVPEEAGSEDVFVPRRHLASAVNGDRVAVRVERRIPGRNPEGRLVRILERAWSQIVGTYRERKGYGTVVPLEPPLRTEIFVPEALRGAATDSDVVLVEIEEWGKEEARPVGAVSRVLGRPGEPGLDILAIQLGHQLPFEFPVDAEREAEKIARRGLRPEDVRGREDFRDTLTFTVDPADAKDHDDALSATWLEDGGIEVGVHIADVSWYVKEGSALDREALDRGTSVYLVDRVIPMLPEALSSHLCSLVPGEDRLTVSAVFRFDSRGVLTDSRVVRGVIRSRFRLSYEQAQAHLDGGRGENETLDGVAASLAVLSEVAGRLRKARRAAGAIDFAVPEAQVELSEDGQPLAIRARPRLETHRIVEDLMILANETVARLGLDNGFPVIFRIHEDPDPDRVQALRELTSFFGLTLPSREVRPLDLARLVDSVRGQPHEYLISTVTLRSMRQARYSTTNAGHFGLALEAYAHFTSPIRRYPDLAVHREITRWLKGGEPRSEAALDNVARHASARERRAQEAERESVDAKKIEFMGRHLGDEFGGTISGVTSFGLFVTLDDVMTEGLIRLSSLVDDYYRYDADAHAVIGRRRRHRYRLGDRITVQVVRVDVETRTIDLEPAEESA